MTTTVGDLILEGISFLNIPEDLKPPEQGKYAIEAQTEFSEEVLKAKGEEIRGLIGIRIPQQPSTFTPLQKKKITVIATGLLALGGAAWLAASVPAMIPIAGIVMVASGVLIPYKLYQYCSRYDLDLDSERTPLRLSIRKWDIAKLTKTFSFEELIGYDLLQGKLGTLDEISK
ncbi:MAG: hypothetical protein FJZ63_02735, partial [Chlamydiae bacterium]|nr:hypothetical protein [Chlamydiota bacterium]